MDDSGFSLWRTSSWTARCLRPWSRFWAPWKIRGATGPQLHPLTDILVLSVPAVICGADSFVAIALFGQIHEEWLRTFLELPHGIPSHDTLGRVFARLDASGFEEGFRDWVQEAFARTDGQVVAVDGQSVRGSHDRGRGLGALHLVSAWAQANRLVLAQTAVDDKSNEITAIPELLRMLVLKGCIVTLDAMGCQKAIARPIRKQGADHVLRVRDNHQGLHARLKDTFALERAGGFAGYAHDDADTVGKDHGRIETRRCRATGDPALLAHADPDRAWCDRACLVRVESERRCGDRVTTDVRIFICRPPDLRHLSLANSRFTPATASAAPCRCSHANQGPGPHDYTPAPRRGGRRPVTTVSLIRGVCSPRASGSAKAEPTPSWGRHHARRAGPGW